MHGVKTVGNSGKTEETGSTGLFAYSEQLSLSTTAYIFMIESMSLRSEIFHSL